MNFDDSHRAILRRLWRGESVYLGDLGELLRARLVRIERASWRAVLTDVGRDAIGIPRQADIEMVNGKPFAHHRRGQAMEPPRR